MTDMDFSSPEHRLDNLSKGMFYRAYATIFALVHNETLADNPVSDLRVMFSVMNRDLAQAFDVLPSTWVNKLFAVGDTFRNVKDGQEEAESGEG